jgi:hypothetical protein
MKIPQLYIDRPSVRPHTLVNVNGIIERAKIEKNDDIQKIINAGGVVLEDWETAEKVAFGLLADDGSTLKKLAWWKFPLFVPNELPDWATMIEI